MRIVGTVSECRNDKGLYILTIRGLPRKMVMRINYGASSTDANGNISKFSIKERNPSNPNDWMLISTSVDDLDDYMARKAYMSWEVDEVTGLYTMEVSLAE